MKLKYYRDVKGEPVDEIGAAKVTRRILISPEDGAPNFIMRVFEIEPSGHTPYHTHPFEHEIFVKSGFGILVFEGKDYPVKAGNVVFIQGNEKHQFRNTGKELLEIICLIPKMN